MITINNQRPCEQLENVLTCEKHFLQFLKTYRFDWSEVKYRVERSIDDEIKREFQSDIQTVRISYLIVLL